MAITLKTSANRLKMVDVFPTAISYGLKSGIFKPRKANVALRFSAHTVRRRPTFVVQLLIGSPLPSRFDFCTPAAIPVKLSVFAMMASSYSVAMRRADSLSLKAAQAPVPVGHPTDARSRY